MILVFGGETLRDFAFAMMVGVISGTYSSIFIATPVLIAWKEREPQYRSRAARIRELMGSVPAFPEDNLVAKVGGGTERDAVAGIEDAESSRRSRRRPRTRSARAPSRRGRARGARPVAGRDGNGAEPEPEPEPVAATPATDEMTDRERRLAERKRRQARKNRKHGRPS